MIVVDASTALACRLFDAEQTLHASHLIDVEVAQVLRRSVRRGEIDWERCRVTLTALAEVLDAPLLTRDQRLAASPAHRARVELVRASTEAIGPRPISSAAVPCR